MSTFTFKYLHSFDVSLAIQFKTTHVAARRVGVLGMGESDSSACLVLPRPNQQGMVSTVDMSLILCSMFSRKAVGQKVPEYYGIIKVFEAARV
jgi:hypothetical protein